MTELIQQTAAPPPAQLRIELAHSEPDARAAVHVLTRIWPQPDGHEPVTPELAWVLAHSGNYVALALAGDRVVGSALAFRAQDAHGPHLHSHIAGVLPDRQGSNIGFALKQHQRRWALANGLDRITWTFDPLVARNAYFNVSKLGARLTGYHVNFYGEMNDGINNGDETDRCVVTWPLTDDRVVAAAGGEHAVPERDAVRRRGAEVALHVGADGAPVLGEVDGADVRMLQLPHDVIGLRVTDPGLARAWREGMREVLVDAFRS